MGSGNPIVDGCVLHVEEFGQRWNISTFWLPRWDATDPDFFLSTGFSLPADGPLSCSNEIKEEVAARLETHDKYVHIQLMYRIL